MQWQQRLAGAAQQAIQSGKLEGDMARMVDYLLQPKLPWRMLLARFMTATARDDYNYSRPSTRRGDPAIYPSLRSSETNIVVAVDTSGSISEEEIKEFKLDEQPPPDPMQEALVENVIMQTEQLIADIRNKDADTQNKLYKTLDESISSLETIIKSLAEKVEAGAPITPEEQDILEAQVAVVGDAQIDTLEKNELAGSKSIDMKNAEQQEAIEPQYQPEGPSGPVGPRPGPQLPDGVEQ